MTDQLVFKFNNCEDTIITNFEDLRSSLGTFIKPVYQDIKVIELKKLFLVPYLKLVHNLKLDYYNIEDIKYGENNSNLIRFSRTDIIDTLPTYVEVLVRYDYHIGKLKERLLDTEYASLKEYFEEYTKDDILEFSAEEVAQIVEPRLRLLALKFYKELS